MPTCFVVFCICEIFVRLAFIYVQLIHNHEFVPLQISVPLQMYAEYFYMFYASKSHVLFHACYFAHVFPFVILSSLDFLNDAITVSVSFILSFVLPKQVVVISVESNYCFVAVIYVVHW